MLAAVAREHMEGTNQYFLRLQMSGASISMAESILHSLPLVVTVEALEEDVK